MMDTETPLDGGEPQASDQVIDEATVRAGELLDTSLIHKSLTIIQKHCS